MEPNIKLDQATIVAQSVSMLSSLKDEVSELKEKLRQMQLKEQQAEEERRHYKERERDRQFETLSHGHNHIPFPNTSNSQFIPSPFSSMMSSLNGAGVAMWRGGLNGKILEVNLVFELVTGFTSSEIVGGTPCAAPLFGSLSVIPSAFLQRFSQVTPLAAPVTSPRTAAPSSSSSTPSPQLAQQPSQSPVSPPSPASSVDSDISTSSSAAAPLYANSSITHFPIVPQNELQSFFPFKCKSILDPNTSEKEQQKHGFYLVSHLAALPPNHVLKLLARYNTLWGDILESIVTMCLIRDEKGQPDYILVLSTPDCRRLLKASRATIPTCKQLLLDEQEMISRAASRGASLPGTPAQVLSNSGSPNSLVNTSDNKSMSHSSPLPNVYSPGINNGNNVNSNNTPPSNTYPSYDSFAPSQPLPSSSNIAQNNSVPYSQYMPPGF